MPPALDDDLIRRIAHLARLKPTDEQRARYRDDLARILAHFDALRDLDIAAVEPTAHAVEVVNVFRDDVPGDTLAPDQALANAAVRDGPYFAVPQVLDQRNA